MGIFSAFVLFAMVWSMIFLLLLQVGQHTQGDEGRVTQGTHASSPVEFSLKKRVLIAPGISVVIWGVLVYVIVSGLIGIDDLPRLGREAT